MYMTSKVVYQQDTQSYVITLTIGPEQRSNFISKTSLTAVGKTEEDLLNIVKCKVAEFNMRNASEMYH